MIKKCDVVLADEPTGSLDFQNGEIVMEILSELHEKGKTIVLVTHNRELKKYATKVIEL